MDDMINIVNIIMNYIIDIWGTVRNQNKDKWIVYSLKREFIVNNEGSLTRWLNNNIGEYNKDWHVYHYANHSDYMFKTKESSTMFMLVWLTGDNSA